MNRLYEEGYYNIWGFDLAESGIKVAKTIFPELNDRFIIHDSYNENLPDYFPKTFDIVISSEVIEHLFSPQKYLSNINKWLKNGGYFIITTPYHGYFKNLSIALLNKNDAHQNVFWEGGHIKFFSKKTLYKMLIEAKLSPFYFQGVGRFYFFWKSMLILSEKL